MDTATDFSRVDLLLYLTERLESGTQAGIQDALALATRMLQMKFGIISKVVGDDYLVERVAPADGELQQGQRFSLGQTFCCNTLKANDVVSISDADTEAWRGHPCYTELGVGSYIGVPLRVGGRARGTLNFSGPTAREEPWADSDRQLVRLLGHWVEAALEQEELRTFLLLGALYLVQGMPYGFQSQGLRIALTERGVSLTDVGLAGALALVGSLPALTRLSISTKTGQATQMEE